MIISILQSEIITKDRFLSFKYLNSYITKHNHQKWLDAWKSNSKTSKHYEKFDTIFENSKIQLLSKKFSKHVISTIMHLNRTWLFQIILNQTVKLRNENMQRKLQLRSKFEAFTTQFSTFHKWEIKYDQWNEVSNNFVENTIRDKKEHRSSRKICDWHRNLHKKMNLRWRKRKREKELDKRRLNWR